MDRRNYPRLYTHFPAELVAGGKRAVDRVLAIDVSITGLQVVCDRRVAERVVPKADPRKVDAAKPVQVRVVLPLKDGTHVEVDVRCKVRTVREHINSEYRLGLEYDYFEGKSYNALEAFIDDWVEFPDEPSAAR
jgi:c-di-GMP-binding flagellar brake protein YcgR